MKITPSNILLHELIGLRAEVEESSNSSEKGICGSVVDETRNMLIIENEHRKEKKIPKAENVFIFELPGDERVKVRVRGDMLVSRPEDRIKK
ncbi:MAG: ribonuclease P protein component 1 [Methanophagales archaeon]|nr:ribonuclease P protein component 1 [Methanophagales archaeon]MCW3141451.1 ribonuclease P protein component 1 [Methanophagales archaeon]